MGGEAWGRRCDPTAAPTDPTVERDAAEWIARAVGECGGVDILYNNASFACVGPWDELTLEEWRFSMTYELDIVFISTRAAWPELVRRGGGVIINVASVAARPSRTRRYVRLAASDSRDLGFGGWDAEFWL